ncbi:Nn.00g056380.m01.CDS01 [Neocucurbitaria sp. VM-36]
MFHHHEPNDPANQPRPQTISPDRPPQLKWQNCGYRCGLGCEEPGEDEGDSEGSDNDTLSTLVDTDDGESRGVELQNEELESREVYQQADLLHEDGLDDEDIGVVVLLSGSPSEYEDLSTHSRSPLDYDESLDVGPCATGDHSTVASGFEGVEYRSPGPGIDYLMMGIPRFPTAYYFLETPLRLSPQYEHCRGHPACHMVPQDEMSYLEIMQDIWRTQIPEDGFAF